MAMNSVEMKKVTIPVGPISGLLSSVLEVDGQQGKFYSHLFIAASEDKFVKHSQFVVEHDSYIAQPGEIVTIEAEMESSAFDRPFVYNQNHKKAGQQGLFRESKTRIRFVKKIPN